MLMYWQVASRLQNFGGNELCQDCTGTLNAMLSSRYFVIMNHIKYAPSECNATDVLASIDVMKGCNG